MNPSSVSSSSSRDCGVCYEPYDPREHLPTVINPCHHTFCQQCVNTVRARDNLCPTCRIQIERTGTNFQFRDALVDLANDATRAATAERERQTLKVQLEEADRTIALREQKDEDALGLSKRSNALPVLGQSQGAASSAEANTHPNVDKNPQQAPPALDANQVARINDVQQRVIVEEALNPVIVLHFDSVIFSNWTLSPVMRLANGSTWRMEHWLGRNKNLRTWERNDRIKIERIPADFHWKGFRHYAYKFTNLRLLSSLKGEENQQ